MSNYTKFNGRSWMFSTKDWTFYQKMKAIAGTSKGDISEERFRALIHALINYAYENDLGALRNAFYNAYTEDK